MNAILFIDTTDTEMTRVAVEIDGVYFEKTSNSRILKSQTVLPLIEDLVKEHGLSVSDITEIRVGTGPGSYTGIRVGLSIANMLGAFLAIPVNGKHALALPVY